MRLIAVRQLQRAIESIGMRPRQHRERAQSLRKPIRQRPRDTAAPVVADEMKAVFAIARCGDDRHRIVHQALDMIVRGIADVRPRAGRITALTRRNGAIAGGGKRFYLRAPAIHGLRKAVQQQHQRCTGFARDERVEGETG
jgi:hypothetical protein